MGTHKSTSEYVFTTVGAVSCLILERDIERLLRVFSDIPRVHEENVYAMIDMAGDLGHFQVY